MKFLIALFALVILPVASSGQTAEVESSDVFAPPSALSESNHQIVSLYAQAEDAYVVNDYEGVLRILDQIVAVDPSDPAPIASKANIHTIRGTAKYNSAIDQKDPNSKKLTMEAARDELREAADDAERSYGLLVAMAQRPQNAVAVEARRKMVLRSRANARRMSVLAVDPSGVWVALSAIHDYISIEEDPRHQFGMQILGAEMLLKAEQPNEALAEFTKVAEFNPASINAVLGKAVSKIDVAFQTKDDQKLREGLDDLKFFISQAPDSNRYKGSAEDAFAYLTEPPAIPDYASFLFAGMQGKDQENKLSLLEKSGRFENGRAISLPYPPYPLIARFARAHGTVVVQAFIDEKGNVIGARCQEGHPLLQAAAIAVARMAKFSVTTLDGKPVKVTGIIKYNFNLDY